MFIFHLRGVYTIQQTSSKLPADVQQFACILNTFAGSLLDHVNTLLLTQNKWRFSAHRPKCGHYL